MVTKEIKKVTDIACSRLKVKKAAKTSVIPLGLEKEVRELRLHGRLPNESEI